MQHTEHLVCGLHSSDHGVPGGVFEAVTVAGKDECEDKDGVGRVLRDDYVGDKAGAGAQEGDAALTIVLVDGDVGDGGNAVADNGGEENQGDGGVGLMVVDFELEKVLVVCKFIE